MAKYDHEGPNPLVDDTGNGMDATNGGGVTFEAPPAPGNFELGDTSGKYTGASSSRLDVPPLYAPGDDFTFTAMVYKDASESHQTILSSDRFRFQFQQGTATGDGVGALRLDVNSPGVSGPANSADIFNTEQWYFVVFRYDATTHVIDMFLEDDTDRDLAGPVFTKMAYGTDGIGDMSMFRVGGDGLSGIGGFDGFRGYIDGVRFYDVWLSNAELEHVFGTYRVPEPNTIALLMLAGVCLIGRRRRRA